MGRYEVEKKEWTWPSKSNMTDLPLPNKVITPLHSVIAYPLYRSPEIMLVSSTLNSTLKHYTILKLYPPMITLLWAYQASLTLVFDRLSKTTRRQWRLPTQSNNWLDQCQSGKLVIGSRVQSFLCAFLSSTEVPVLLLNQPIIPFLVTQGQSDSL